MGRFHIRKDSYPRGYHYVKNQENHHKKTKFRDEYIFLLNKYEVEYDERYIFHQVL